MQVKLNNIQKLKKKDQVRFVPNLQEKNQCSKSVTVARDINRLKEKHIIILIDAEKVFDKSQCLPIIKTLGKLGTEGKEVATSSENLQLLSYVPVSNQILY